MIGSVTARPLDAARGALISLQAQLIAMLSAQNGAAIGYPSASCSAAPINKR